MHRVQRTREGERTSNVVVRVADWEPALGAGLERVRTEKLRCLGLQPQARPPLLRRQSIEKFFPTVTAAGPNAGTFAVLNCETRQRATGLVL